MDPHERAFNLFIESMKTKISNVEKLPFARFLKHELKKLLTSNKLVILKGLRGVGKTTLMLQIAAELWKAGKNVFYFSADHPILRTTTLYEFVHFLMKKNFDFIFIDEIHLKSRWNNDIKALYDDFDLHIFVSGSSALSLTKGKADLSRRAILRELPPLSLREYLAMNDRTFDKITFQEIVKNWKTLQKKLPYIQIEEYYSKALPFFREPNYDERLLAIVDRMIEKDLAQYPITSESLNIAKNVVVYLALTPPSEITISSLSHSLGISKGLVNSLLNFFEDMGLIHKLLPAGGIKTKLRKPYKILMVPPFRWAFAKLFGKMLDTGSIREEFFVHHVKNAGLNVFHIPGGKGDFLVEDFIFEIGGKTKTKRQITEWKNAFVVKDVSFSTDSIPLYLFGYLF